MERPETRSLWRLHTMLRTLSSRRLWLSSLKPSAPHCRANGSGSYAVRSGKRLEARGKVAQPLRLPGDLETTQCLASILQLPEDFDDVVGVRLGVDAPGHGKAHQVHGCFTFGAIGSLTEHHRTDFARTDAAVLVQRDHQSLPGILPRRNVRQKSARIDEHGMTADRSYDRHA